MLLLDYEAYRLPLVTSITRQDFFALETFYYQSGLRIIQLDFIITQDSVNWNILSSLYKGY